MSSRIDISELRVGYVLGAPIYDDANVKLLGQGVSITEKFISQLRRRGIRSVQVTEEDLAKLRGWKLSVDRPAQVPPAASPGTAETAVPADPEPRVDHARFRRYLAAISQVGRQTRTNISPLRMIREAAQQAARALQAEHFGFGLVIPDRPGMSLFLGAPTAQNEAPQKLVLHNVEISTNRSLLVASLTAGGPQVVDNADDDRWHDELLQQLHIKSAVTAPLHRGTLRAGIMAMLYTQPRTLDDHDLAFLETVANIVTVPTTMEPAELAAEAEPATEAVTPDDPHANRKYDYRCWQGITPLDGERGPQQTAYEEVLCRDISMRGFSFYYPRRPDFQQLAVALGQPPNLKQMKATVVSCQGTEVDGEPCALVSCQFAGPLLSS